MSSSLIASSCDWATPVYRLDSFCGGNEIWIKRDDLIPFCFGGNKARIAACFMDEMRKGSFSCMVGYGSAGSNLSRALACACAGAGMRCVIISPRDSGDCATRPFNEYLVHMFGAELVCCDKKDVRATVAGTLCRLRAQGEKPYYIYGDETGQGNESAPIGAYAGFWDGLAEQCDCAFDELFLACGTGMTLGGILADAAHAGATCSVMGVSIARPAAMAADCVKRYLDAADLAPEVSARIPAWKIWDGGLRGGYGLSDEQERAVVRRLLSCEGVPADLTYVGKAFAGMLDLLRERGASGKKVLFLHTGGTPLFFDDCLVGEVNA